MINFINWLFGFGQEVFRHIPDPRDLHFKELLLGEYKNKYPSKQLAPLFPENQYRLSCCSFEAWKNALDVYFGQEVSTKWLVAKAYQQKLCDNTGRAELRSGAKVAQKFGVVFESDLPSNEQDEFSEFVKVDFTKFDPIALKNIIGSYYFIDTPHELLQSVDAGYAVVMGRDFVVPNPFTPPWVINRTGTTVGAHSTVLVGYSQDGVLLDLLNSWGTMWGDKGHFYLSLGDVQQDIDTYGALAITPIPYTPKDVKLKGLKDQLANLVILIKKMTNIMNASSILYATAKKYIGSNLDPANQPTACAGSVSFILRKAFDDNVRLASTSDLYNWLKVNPKFEEVDTPEKGAIIITPTSSIPDYSPLKGDNKHGHTGCVGQYKAEDGSFYVMSNNSETYQWDTQFTIQKWTDYFKTYAGGKIYFFRRLVV